MNLTNRYRLPPYTRSPLSTGWYSDQLEKNLKGSMAKYFTRGSLQADVEITDDCNGTAQGLERIILLHKYNILVEKPTHELKNPSSSVY